MNAPFEENKKVLTKACLEGCRMVMIAPLWENCDWRNLLERFNIAVDEIPENRPVFEGFNGPERLSPRHWALSAYFVDTTVRKVSEDDLDPLLVS